MPGPMQMAPVPILWEWHPRASRLEKLQGAEIGRDGMAWP